MSCLTRNRLGWVAALALGLLLPGVVLAQMDQSVPTVRPVVLSSTPHDAQAFTQGLLLHAGSFYESTGLYGRSSLREVEPGTGRVIRSVELAADEFGEGLALVEGRLLLLTWRNQVAHEYSLADFTRQANFAYEGEGWGLCYDGQRLIMSDGSDVLQFRDAQSFELLSTLPVTLGGAPVLQINELECVGGSVFANVWQTDNIVQIDAKSGEVLRVVDAAGLLSPTEAASADVLNGIAYDASTGHFFITGKLWPWLFEVTIAHADLGGTALDAGKQADAGRPQVDAGRPRTDAGTSATGTSTTGTSTVAAPSFDASAADASFGADSGSVHPGGAHPGKVPPRGTGCACVMPGAQGRYSVNGLLILLGVGAATALRARRR